MNRERFSTSFWFPIIAIGVPFISRPSQPLLPSTVGTLSLGVQGRPWKESLLYLHLQEFGCGHLQPRQKKNNPAFSCPARSEPPQGPDCVKSHHHRSTYYPATISHHSLGSDSPVTAFPAGNSETIPRSRCDPVSPAGSHRGCCSSSSGRAHWARRAPACPAHIQLPASQRLPPHTGIPVLCQNSCGRV